MTVTLDDFLELCYFRGCVFLGGQQKFMISFLSLMENGGLCLSLGFQGTDYVLVLPSDFGRKTADLAKLATGIQSDTSERRWNYLSFDLIIGRWDAFQNLHSV